MLNIATDRAQDYTGGLLIIPRATAPPHSLEGPCTWKHSLQLLSHDTPTSDWRTRSVGGGYSLLWHPYHRASKYTQGMSAAQGVGRSHWTGTSSSSQLSMTTSFSQEQMYWALNIEWSTLGRHRAAPLSPDSSTALLHQLTGTCPWSSTGFHHQSPPRPHDSLPQAPRDADTGMQIYEALGRMRGQPTPGLLIGGRLELQDSRWPSRKPT